jgi:hypothetical protein
MPCLNQELLVLSDQTFDPVHFMIGKPEVFRKLDWFKPELRHMPISFHMDVHRLASIRAEEHKFVGTDCENRWHLI